VFEAPPFHRPTNLLVSSVINPSTVSPKIRQPTRLILVVITSCKIKRRNRLGTPCYRNVGPFEVVDIEVIQALVGRVKWPNSRNWFIIQRDRIFSRIQLADDDGLEWVAWRALREQQSLTSSL